MHTRVANYKMPYPQELLGQKYGLTSRDISLALDIEHKNILQKIARPEFKAMCEYNGWNLAAAAAKTNERGRPGIIFAMETNIAKALVATTSKKEGWGYLKFLLDCEKIATELTPKLIAQNEALKQENAFLKAQKGPLKLPSNRKDAIPAPVSYAEDIFGDMQVMEIRWVKKTDLSELELARAIKKHCLAVGAGAIERARKLDHTTDLKDKKLHKNIQTLLD